MDEVITQEATRETTERVAAPSRSKLAIISYSGTVDKLIPLGVLAQAAAAMGFAVEIYVTGFSLLAFTKEHHELPFAAEYAAMAPQLVESLSANKVAPWDEMLRQAKDLGAKVHACSMMSAVMGLGPDDFGDLVDDVVGAATFVTAAEGAETFFI
jgi:peroxiredoxin family protein